MLIFAAYDAAGAPLTGLTPSWIAIYDAGTGLAIAALDQPAFAEIGLGLYQADSDLTAVMAGIIDLGGAAIPRYLHMDAENYYTFAGYSVALAPLAGLVPVWTSFVDDDGVAAAQPVLSELGDGLYKIAYVGIETRTGIIDLGATASPRYLSWRYGADDASAPVIANMTPAPGLVDRMTPVEFDVTDVAPGLVRVVITLKYANRVEALVVHDGLIFQPPFDTALSSRTAIADGFHFTLLPASGWVGDFDLDVLAIDGAGNLV